MMMRPCPPIGLDLSKYGRGLIGISGMEAGFQAVGKPPMLNIDQEENPLPERTQTLRMEKSNVGHYVWPTSGVIYTPNSMPLNSTAGHAITDDVLGKRSRFYEFQEMYITGLYTHWEPKTRRRLWLLGSLAFVSWFGS